MMSTSQERLIRRLIKIGGKLTLPSNQGGVQIECTRAPAGALWCIDQLIIRKSDKVIAHYRRWQGRTLYPEVASRLDSLLDDQEVAA